MAQNMNMMGMFGSHDPFGIESGFMANNTQADVEAELAAFKKNLNSQKSPWEDYAITVENDNML